MSATLYAKVVITCDHYECRYRQACREQVETQAKLQEHGSDDRTDLNGLLSVDDYELPAGWTSKWGEFFCPKHKL